MSKYESTFDNNAVRVRLEDTEHGVALSLEMLHEGWDEPSAGTTLYIGQEQIDGMAKWLQEKASRPEAMAHIQRWTIQAVEGRRGLDYTYTTDAEGEWVRWGDVEPYMNSGGTCQHGYKPENCGLCNTRLAPQRD